MACAGCEKRKEKLKTFAADSVEFFKSSTSSDLKTWLGAAALFVAIVALFNRNK